MEKIPQDLLILKTSEDKPAALEVALPALDFKTQASDELLTSIENIPNKLAFKIGEVGEMLGVKQYVLRYWETEFEALKPRKSKNNQRVYTRREVETAFLIKKLLYTDRFSIEGARVALKQLRSQVRQEKDWQAVASEQQQAAEKVRGLLTEIRRIRQIFAN
jgi:DNA-binding transcriptional MerR regulator